MAINYLHFSHRQNMLTSSPNLPKSHPIWQQLSAQNFTIWIRCGCKWGGLGVAFFSLETCELKIQVICSLPAKPHTMVRQGSRQLTPFPEEGNWRHMAGQVLNNSKTQPHIRCQLPWSRDCYLIRACFCSQLLFLAVGSVLRYLFPFPLELVHVYSWVISQLVSCTWKVGGPEVSSFWIILVP